MKYLTIVYGTFWASVALLTSLLYTFSQHLPGKALAVLTLLALVAIFVWLGIVYHRAEIEVKISHLLVLAVLGMVVGRFL